tara:strand:+ start:1074 stop:1316 length:243 start_codon:yes stop_codon:yes gene_type:complete
MSNGTQYELVLQTPIGTKFTSASFVYLVHKANDLVENSDEILSESTVSVKIWEVGSNGCSDVLVAERKKNTTRNDWKFCV